LHVEDQPDNLQLVLVDHQIEQLTVTRIQTGMEDHVPTRTDRTNHGGELIWDPCRKYTKLPWQTEKIVAGTGWEQLRSEWRGPTIQTTMQTPYAHITLELLVVVKQKHYSAASQRQEDLFSLNYELLSTLLFAKLKCLQLEAHLDQLLDLDQQAMLLVEDQPGNLQPVSVELQVGELMVTRIQTGAEDHVPTLTDRTGHGGESIWDLHTKCTELRWQTERIVAGTDWEQLK